jgi:hypothetical protein
MKLAAAGIAAFLFLQAPDASFISEFRKTLRSDNELLQDYSYTETETRTEIDRNGKPKSTEINIYKIAPDGEQLYRRMVSKNGVPMTRDQEMKTPVSPRDDSKIRDELFEIYDIQVERRDSSEGSPVVVLSFRPRPEYKPKSKLASFLTHVSGRAWVNESDHQLIRVEAEVFDSVSYGWFLGSLQEGTRLIAERRKIENGTWLPAMLDIRKSQRVLLKGTHVHEVHEYSEYQKF